MALANYTDLKASIASFMARNDLTGEIPDFIKLAEARLNREIGSVESDITLTGVVGVNTVSTSAHAIVDPSRLWLTDSANGDESELTKKSGFAVADTSDEPKFWEFDDDASAPVIRFNCPLDAAYSLRLRATTRIGLSDSVTTNWLLTNHPDVYLAASIMWGGGFIQGYEQATAFKAILEEAIPEVRNVIAKQKKAVLSVDPALMPWPRYGTYDGTE